MHTIKFKRHKSSDSAFHSIENQTINKENKQDDCAADVFFTEWTTNLVFDALEIGACYDLNHEKKNYAKGSRRLPFSLWTEFYRIPLSSSHSVCRAGSFDPSIRLGMHVIEQKIPMPMPKHPKQYHSKKHQGHMVCHVVLGRVRLRLNSCAVHGMQRMEDEWSMEPRDS